MEESGSLKSKNAERELQILEFWKKNRIFEKTLSKNAPEGDFVFYDGPPFATGLPHYGHILTGTIKDAIPRYKTMRGFYVPRKWGWDCHGLPIENILEKEISLESKKDILDYGIGRFNDAARKGVLRYADEWQKQVPRFGRWVDMEDDYRTMDASYTESIWWAFKELCGKGLIYEGYKSMHICPRCETPLSNFEVSQGYAELTDISVYAKFRLKDFRTSDLPTYILAWTTTPWTLPGNAALAANPDIMYVRIRIKNQESRIEEEYVLAKERVRTVLKDKESEIVEEFKGEELVGLKYEPVFDYYKDDPTIKNRENGWKIYAADFVTTEDGTGIVHIAPAFGSDDYDLARKGNLPFVQHVDGGGKFKPEVKDFAGLLVKPKSTKEEPQAHQGTDVLIIKNLSARGLLFGKEKITHQYPLCWRCDTPLLNYATSSWFVKVSDLREKLVLENEKVKWMPEEIGKYRFGNWLKDAKDWAISRNRFWGAPIPVWKCDKCSAVEVFGSRQSLRDKLKPRNKYFVLRHGEAESNVRGFVSGNRAEDNHLTGKGRSQVKTSASKLKGLDIGLIFASDFVRTKETAEIVQKELGLPADALVFDERLREVNAGIFNGKKASEYHAHFSSLIEKFTKTPPQGENLQDIKNRVGEFLYEVDGKYEGKNILVVSHEYPVWMMDAVRLGWTHGEAAAAKEKKDEYLETGRFAAFDFKSFPHDKNFETDLHKPHIDELVLDCGKCKAREMRRVPEVFDCWFESGSMPFASKHYLGEKLPDFDPGGGLFRKSKGYPADFIAEGLDQTRGWFYSMLVLGVGLFGKSPYERVIVNGQMLAEDGKKMSKRLKNYPDPLDLVSKYGADAIRYYMLSSPVVRAQDLNFSEKGVDETIKKVFNLADNVLQFYLLYTNKTAEFSILNFQFSKSNNVLDKWILARLSQSTEEVTNGLENYELDKASRPIRNFIADLSQWYVRRSRDRIKKGDREALATLRFVLLELSRLMAPFTPFFAEYLYKEAGGGRESVHLENWPEIKTTPSEDALLLGEMVAIREMVSNILEQRSKSNIKVRQPLSKVTVNTRMGQTLWPILAEEVNVKKVEYVRDQSEQAMLDTEITPELKEEGMVREFIRAAQDLRKKNDLDPNDAVLLTVGTNEAGKEFLEKNKEEIQKIAGLSGFSYENLPDGGEIKIEDIPFSLNI